MAVTSEFGVAFVVSSLFVGGAETQVIQLAESLDRRFRPVIVCTKGAGEQASRARDKGLEVVSLDLRSGRDLRLLPRLTEFLRKSRPAIVHCTNFDSTVWGRAAAIASGTPCIVTAEHSSTRVHSRAPVRVVGPIANRLFASRTDRVVACGHSQVDMLVREGNHPDRIRVIMNGVEPALFSTGRDPEVRHSCGIPEDAVAIGVIARLSPEKNIHMLLSAFTRLDSAGPRSHLVIVGDGPCKGDLEASVAASGLDRKVTFLGARSDVPRLLTALDIVVLSSTAETFPLSVLEAMAAGRPVVATDVGDVPRVVLDGETGYVVPSGDAAALADRLTTLNADPELRLSMGRAGRQRVDERYTRSLMTQSYEALFDEILRERGVSDWPGSTHA